MRSSELERCANGVQTSARIQILRACIANVCGRREWRERKGAKIKNEKLLRQKIYQTLIIRVKR